ncbi:MAG: 2-dehydropantoate 2-reductase [Verrucomicrobia bacterium]|nr:MAG: 2-dehydropantoate 2-reductase [Verrucomicrobiota bacterium]
MSQRKDWPRIAVVGAGALVLDKSEGQERIRVAATTEISAIRDCSLILFSVKANDTTETAKQIAPFLQPDATVVCLQNGVDNADRVRAATNVVTVPAVVYVAVSVPEFGRVKHLARGDLIIGPLSERTTEVANVFNRAAISCRISENIEGELWVKLLCNCALNAISALGHARYGQIVQSGDAKQLMQDVVDEVLAVARAAGVVLPGVDDRESGMAAAMKIATQMADAFSSTAQDLNRGRPTEIDALNGYIVRQGAALAVPVPINGALFTLVKLAEQVRV